MKKTAALILSFLYCACMMARVPVYIVAGQSNTDGRASMEEMPVEVRQIVADGGTADIMMSYCNGMSRNVLGRFEPYVPMYEGGNSQRCGFDAILYGKLASRSRQPIYVIKESKGGTAIDTLCSSSGGLYWNADRAWLADAGIARYDRDTKETSGKSLLLQLEANIDSCLRSTLSRHPEGYEIKCIIWHQGESDRKQADSYHDNLRAMVAHLRHHIADVTADTAYLHLPFIAGGVSSRSRQYSEVVEQAKRQLAQEDHDFHFVALEGCELRSDDNLHFNGPGCIQAADRIFRLMESLDLLPSDLR